MSIINLKKLLLVLLCIQVTLNLKAVPCPDHTACPNNNICCSVDGSYSYSCCPSSTRCCEGGRYCCSNKIDKFLQEVNEFNNNREESIVLTSTKSINLENDQVAYLEN